MNQDGTTSGIPTSKTPLNKNKRIPISREKYNKSLGGQHGHPQHKLQSFSENEVNEHERHGETTCSFCHTLMNPIEKVVFKDELDFEVVVKKRRHYFGPYRCSYHFGLKLSTSYRSFSRLNFVIFPHTMLWHCLVPICLASRKKSSSICQYFKRKMVSECGYTSKRAKIPNRLKEENQYGANVQATILSLLNEGCVSMSRTK